MQATPMWNALKIQRVLDALAGLCQTDLGARRASSLPLAGDREQAEQRLDRLAEALVLQRGLQTVPMCPRLEIADLLGHAERGGVLDGLDLAVIGRLARTTAALAAQARRWPDQVHGLKDWIAGQIPDVGLLGTMLAEAIDDEGHLLDTASPTLARLRAEVVHIATRLRRRITELVRETDEAGLLQDEYFTLRDDRYVLPVKSSDKRVLGGIIHGSSQTGLTVYVEPQEMVEGNNQLALAYEAVRREEHRILQELSGFCADQSDDLLRAADLLGDVDVVMASARLAERLEAHRPLFSQDSSFRVRKARHPVLVLDGVRVVANDVRMDPPARWLIVSGPNGGGKTVVLTTLGLLVEMARLGLYVCAAQDSEIPWFDAVEVVLGDAQDLERGLSTFEGHLRAVQRAIDAAGQKDGRLLILFDELATGTEPIAGSALATAILEHLGTAAPTACGCVTTHFEALKLLPLRDEAFQNAALELDPSTLTPTYRLTLGRIGSSSPFALAGRIGLPQAIVDRATQLAGGGGSEVAEMLERLELMRTELQGRVHDVEKQQRSLENARMLLEDQRKNEQKAADRRVEKLAAEALAELAKAGHELEEARRALKAGDRKQIEEAAKVVSSRQVQVERMQTDARGALTGKPRRTEANAAELLPDTVWWHEGLGRLVTIVEADPRGERIRVRAGVLEIRSNLADLRKPVPGEVRPPQRPAERHDKRPDKKPAAPQRAVEGAAPLEGDEAFDDAIALRTPEWTVDLRGERVEEALGEVDRMLDRAVMANATGICVIHGMGTGALRDAVRQHLRRHPQVERYRPGGKGEGGDGATMVWVRS